jgi:D-alanine-D-alanine ligase
MKMENKIRVAVLFGGRSGEHEVSIMSARSVLDAINPEKYIVTEVGISIVGEWYIGEHVWDAFNSNELSNLQRATFLPEPSRCGLFTSQTSSQGEILEHLTHIDVVFPVLHGSFGEDGTLQGLFEMAELAYVGAGVLGSSLGMDKGIFKDIMLAHNIPVVDWFVVTRKEIEKEIASIVQKALDRWDFPIFIKPANLGSSVGVSRCTSPSDMMEGLMYAARYDRRIIVEQGLNAREIEVSVLGNEFPQVSLPGEVIPGREFYSYESKYIDDDSQLLIPAPISPEMTRTVQKMALDAFRAIDCAGMARVDFLLTKTENPEIDAGSLFLSEVNTIPGFTKISMYPKLWQASGLSYSQLIDKLIDLALDRKAERDRTERKFKEV